MAEWPDVTELAAILDIEDTTTWSDHLDGVLAAAILRVQHDVGNWDEYEDEPDDMLAKAALRMGELIATRPSANERDLGKDETYLGLMKGHRRVFGFH